MIMTADQDIAQAPIQDVVKLPGGNGLASPAFQIPLNILLIYGWHNIEQGVEACVCDGVLIPKTKIRSELMRLIGRKSFVRRVLLKPPPLEIVASGLTRDLLKLSLTIAIKYEVKEPVVVASLADPLGELKNIIEGISSEFIRLNSFDYFISDEGAVRKQLQNRIQDTDTVKGIYLIYEVLKAIPSGDETLLEISRQTEAAKKQKGLIEAEGLNREEEAKHDLEIARKQADLDDEMARRKHEREKEIRELEAREEILKTAISALGQVAGAGIDPSKVTKDVIGTLADSIQHTHLANVSTPALPESPDSQPVIEIDHKEISQLDKEKRSMESIKNKLGITTYDLLEANSRITGAIVQMREYEIMFKCGENYPFEEPLATIRFPDGTTQSIEDYWFPGASNSLAQAVVTISLQIRSDK
jgi:hypothetical protein